MSGELLARLSASPKVKEVLDTLPPKMLGLATGKSPEVVHVESMSLDVRVKKVVARIQKATFTGKGDKEAGEWQAGFETAL